MPVTFYGTYYTVDEVMKPLGRTYSIGCRYIKRLGLTPIKIGNKIMLNEDERKAIIDLVDKMDLWKTSYTILEASKKAVLGVPHKDLQEMVMSGDIPTEKDAMGQPRITEETVYIIQNSGFLNGRATAWGKIAELFKEEEV